MEKLKIKLEESVLLRHILSLLILCLFVGLIYVYYQTELPKAVKLSTWLIHIPLGILIYKTGIWKTSGIYFLIFILIAGLLMVVPRVPRLHETIRNLFYHVPLWMVMITQLLVSLINAILYLKNSNEKNDLMAEQTARVGVLFGLLGLATGMVWAKATWGSFWHNDPKQIAAAIAILIYFAYFILRSSIEDPDKKARISNIYNIFCFPTFLMLIFIVPQVIPGSSHPVKLIVNKEMRVVYYPALLAWLFLSAWLVNLGLRVKKIEKQQHEAI